MGKNLVVMPFGNGSLRSRWITDCANRNFDVVLLGYHTIVDQEILTNTFVKIFHYHSYKWWMIQDFFSQHEHYLKEYSSFFFLDDDIEVTGVQINKIFDCFNYLSVQLAQPSLTADSYMSWPVLKHKKYSGLRYVTTVELMCPLMKKPALEKLLPTFKLTKSGWGVDLLWGKLIAEFFGNWKIVVLDITQVKHGKPVGKGELYTKLDQPAKTEEDTLRINYNLQDFEIRKICTWKNKWQGRLLSYLYLARFRA
jgi:hypothetical protein